MSSYRIIQLSSDPIKEEDHITDCNICEDALFLMESDWGGDTLEYEDEIDDIASSFEEVADIDKDARTITFKDKDTIKEILREHVRKCCERFMKDTAEGRWTTAEYSLRSEITEPCGIDNLLHIGYCQKASTVLADYIAGYHPQTMYIGGILYAHY